MSFDLWRPHMRKAHIDSWNKLRHTFGNAVGPCPAVEWSNRMTATAGVAYVEKGFIRLSNKLFWQYPEGFILEIVPHELAHVAAFRRFNDCGHGKGWKDCMEALGITPHRCWSPSRMIQHRKTFEALE